MSGDEDRRDQLAANLDSVRRRIDRAMDDAGRRDEVRLIVVTKTFPAGDVDLLATLGVTDVAENRDQEARLKHEACGPQARDLTWRMIGQLQRNKANHVVRWADTVDSVDRLALVPALGRAAEPREDPLGILLQVNLDPQPEAGRGGVLPDDLLMLAEAVAAHPTLRLDGVMGVAPHPGAGPVRDTAGPAFARLWKLSEALQREHPGAGAVSAGMSGDLEVAIENGATQVRVGGAILGARPRVQ